MTEKGGLLSGVIELDRNVAEGQSFFELRPKAKLFCFRPNSFW